VNEASEYSITCRPVKIAAKIIVNTEPTIAPFLSPNIKAWCDQVTVAPDESNNKVFKKGILKGSKAVIPIGGHV
jgi:hypothetical protein